MALFAPAIFLSAFLLFQVQPLVAKEILPWFGGSAAVWTACMLFFQLALLLGYSYAHLLTSRGTSRLQRNLHRSLLALSLLALPVIPSSFWKPANAGVPLWRILALLTVTIGFPYFLLASTSPLLQTWYTKVRKSGVPYRFFALSNLGSMLALISYPTLIEPGIPLRAQAWFWSGGYVVTAVLCFVLAGLSSAELPEPVGGPKFMAALAPTRRQRFVWIALSGCASALLLAITNHLTQNIAAIPLLWVLPLAIYLLSFILAFEHSRWYPRGLYLGLFAVAIGSMGYALGSGGMFRSIRVLMPLFLIGLFVCCMVCHGELSRRKPAPAYLTSFYLMMSVGGACGGLFVAAIAPYIFPVLLELPLLLILTGGLILWLCREDRPSAENRRQEMQRAQFTGIWMSACAALVLLAGYLGYQELDTLKGARLAQRNFYGSLRVVDDEEFGVRQLLHGTINHGAQYLDPVRRRTPTSYYAPASGIGMLLTEVSRSGPKRVGVVGLGTGTLAAYGKTGDVIRFYEINPLVRDIAYSQFSFLRDSPAEVDVVLGDARLTLERQPPQNFSVLVVDAFSGDSIPVHLLTREAFQIYWRHLQPGGVLAIHISNKYLDLGPPIEQLARESGHSVHLVENDREKNTQTFGADWMLIGGSRLDNYPFLENEDYEIDTIPGLHPWTDDFSNIWQILK